MASIFISYRRTDSRHFTYRLQERLQRALEYDSVFVDAHMHAGAEYPNEIRSQLSDSEAVLVVIGNAWVRCFDRREEKDWVVEEILQALSERKPIIPVLIDGAPIPAETELPKEIRPLLRFQFEHFPQPGRFEEDSTRLLDSLRLCAPKDYFLEAIELGCLGRETSSTVGTGLNNHGDVCGGSTTVNGFQRAFLWRFEDRTMIELGMIGCNESCADSLNDELMVVGWSEDAENKKRAFVMDTSSYFSTKRSGDGMVDIGVPASRDTRATSINNRNEIVGIFGDVYGDVPVRGFHSDRGEGFIRIEPVDGCQHSVAHAINDFGLIAGSSYSTQYRAWYACSFSRGPDGATHIGRDYRIREEFNTCCSEFFALNNNGDLVGRTRRPPDSQRIDQGLMVSESGEIASIRWPNDSHGRFLDVNSAGHAVGTIQPDGGRSSKIPVLWDGRDLTVLDYRSVSGLGSETRLAEGVCINDSGMILCRGSSNGLQRSFLLIPLSKR